MLVDLTKTEIEKKLIRSENENEILRDKVEMLEKKMCVIFPEVYEMRMAFKELGLLKIVRV